MIYLTTGANGACKTCMTLADVRAQQLKENRPVFYHGFEPVEAVLEAQFGWRKHDPEKWNLDEEAGGVPDGAILFWDEAQTYLGAKQWGTGQPPKWVMDLGVYRRKRGIDIWITGPHPSMFHVSVRRLIASPSWHRHLKRVFGQDVSSQITYDAPNLRCEEPGSGGQAEVKLRPFPKEVYSWYKSSSLHTGKKKIPRAVWMLIGAVVIVPTLIYVAQSAFFGAAEKRAAVIAGKAGSKAAGSPEGASGGVAGGAGPGRAQPTPQQSRAEYLEAQVPRIPGFPHTAPVYDGATQVTVAPYPAACIEGKKPGTKVDVCQCWTQQATLLQTPKEICSQIARQGFFIPWAQVQHAPAVQPAAAVQSSPARAAAVVPKDEAQAKPVEAPLVAEPVLTQVADRDATVVKGMRSGNRVY